MTADFGGARAGITGDGRADALARESLAAAEAKFGGLSPAETIRSAAARLRETLGGALGGPWTSDGAEVYTDLGDGIHGEWVGESLDAEDGYSGAGNAAYIALVNPVVGLAVADWLDRFADLYEASTHRNRPVFGDLYAALAVARALLAPSGEEGGR